MKNENFIKIGTFLLSLIAISFSTVSFFRSCSSEKELKETNYMLSSIEYRPRLKLLNPKIEKINYNFDPIPLKDPESLDSIVDVNVKLDLKFKILVSNIGNSTAKFRAVMFIDTTSEEKILNKLLYERKGINLFKSNQKITQNLYQEIIPFDTTSIEIDYTPQFVNNKNFCIHILLLYENEIGQLFDTYYWLNYKTKDVIVENPVLNPQDKKALKKFFSELSKLIELNGENNYSKVYSEKEKEMIFNILEK